MPRDDFSPGVRRVLAGRAGHRCSVCGASTSGPSSVPTTIVDIGVAAHITAAAPGGPRYDPSLSRDARRHPDNGIWTCQNCGKLVDSDPNRFTVQELRDMKARAERSAAERLGVPSRQPKWLALSALLPGHLDVLAELALAIEPQPLFLLAEHVGESQPRTMFFLDKLIRRQYVAESLFHRRIPVFFLTPKGRDFSFRIGLL